MSHRTRAGEREAGKTESRDEIGEPDDDDGGLVADLPGVASGDTGTASSCLAKPAKPSEYDGNCANGCTFFNSCTLYLGLCVNEF